MNVYEGDIIVDFGPLPLPYDFILCESCENLLQYAPCVSHPNMYIIKIMVCIYIYIYIYIYI